MTVTERGAVVTAPVEEAYELLETRREGLTTDEVRARLEQFGRNELEHAKSYPVWRIILDQVASPLIYVLLAAGVLTLAIQDYKDSAVIFAVVLLNGVIGFIQEFRASRAIEALRELEAPMARVRREGKVQTIPSAEVVPGDVVLLEAGTRVAADIRLTRSNEMRADESLLTGESLPVEKTEKALEDPETDLADTINFVYAGSMLVEGRGEGIVVYTGTNTELGKIARAVSEVQKVDTPLQHRLHGLANQITIAILAIGAVICLIGWLEGQPLREIGLAAVALAVSAIPEGLPVVVTVVLSIGVKRMADRKALVRKLPAVETMGSTQVICTDKTGTLTQNHMTVQSVIWGPWYTEVREDASLGFPDLECPPGFCTPDDEEAAMAAIHDLLQIAVYCNNSEYTTDEKGRSVFTGNPTEVALLEAATIMAPHLLHDEDGSTPVSEVPFSSARKFMATVHRLPQGNGLVMYAKGSPEVILDRCEQEWSVDGPVPLDRECWLQAATHLAHDGERVIGLAYRPYDDERVAEDDVSDLVFMGLMGIIDPPRPEVPDAMHDCQESGIRVVMITGDHPATARAIARQVAIMGEDDAADRPAGAADAETALSTTLEDDPRVMTGRELDAATDEELAARIDDVAVYARVTPVHKLRIVEQFQAGDSVVAVTGDGVNDAPALRRAHIGISMGKSGTDAAREASDVVLLDDSFASIYEAVKQGRYVFENIRKVVFFLISSGVAEVLALITFMLCFDGILPFTAAMILWINLVTNGLQDVALAFEPGEKFVLRHKPHGLKAPIFDRVILQHISVIAVVFGAGTIGGYFFSMWRHPGEIAMAQTAAATTMVLFQMWHAYSCRSLYVSIFKVPIINNKFLFISTILATGAHLAFVYWPPMNNLFSTAPLPLDDWMYAIGAGAVGVLAMEISKWFLRRRMPAQQDAGWDVG